MSWYLKIAHNVSVLCVYVQLIYRSSASRSSRSVTLRTVFVHQFDQSLTLSAPAPVCRYASCRGTPSLSRSGLTPRRYSIAASTTTYDIARWRLPATTARRGRIGSASYAAASVSATCAHRTSRRVARDNIGADVVAVGARWPMTDELTTVSVSLSITLCIALSTFCRFSPSCRYSAFAVDEEGRRDVTVTSVARRSVIGQRQMPLTAAIPCWCRLPSAVLRALTWTWHRVTMSQHGSRRRATAVDGYS